MKDLIISLVSILFISTAISLFFMETRMACAIPNVVYKEARPSKVGKRPEKKQKKSKAPKESEYFYNAKNKTDPFAPFIVRREKTLSQLKRDTKSEQYQKMLALLKDLKIPKTELQRIHLSSLALTAIIKGPGKVMAMVKGPKEGKGFLLEKGTFIGTNGGVVEEIVSEEKETDLGKQLTRKIIIKEPYLDVEGNLKYKMVEMGMAGLSPYK